MRLVIASTAVTQDSTKYSLEALNVMRQQAFGKLVFYEGKLWVVNDAEIVPVVFVGDDADRDKTHILIVDLKLAADAIDTVEADCELCSRTNQMKPDGVRLAGVPLDVCLRSTEFTKALACLMMSRGLETDLWVALRDAVEPEERKT